MTDEDYDAALIGGAFALGASAGWPAVSVIAAAREAGLALERARPRFANVHAILRRFGQQADALALSGALDSGPVRERLFDVLMRRFDALQQHRAGVLALLRYLPADPVTALMLGVETTGSMGWMLNAAGVPTGGVRGAVATQGTVAVWLATLRAWEKDDSADLSGTMAALDRALNRAERVAGWIGQTVAPEPEPAPKPFPDPEAEMGQAGAAYGAADMTPPEMS